MYLMYILLLSYRHTKLSTTVPFRSYSALTETGTVTHHKALLLGLWICNYSCPWSWVTLGSWLLFIPSLLYCMGYCPLTAPLSNCECAWWQLHYDPFPSQSLLSFAGIFTPKGPFLGLLIWLIVFGFLWIRQGHLPPPPSLSAGRAPSPRMLNLDSPGSQLQSTTAMHLGH